MAPQAVGADSREQVGVVLQLTLFWTLVVLGPLTSVAVYFMGDILIALNLISYAGDAGSGSGAESWFYDSHHHTETQAIMSFSHASTWWILPYVAVTTVTTWLDSISVVQAPSFISAFW